MSRVLACACVAAIVGLGAGNLYGAGHGDLGCVGCHVPHMAGSPTDVTYGGIPLWNPALAADAVPAFSLYSSVTFNALAASPTQPDGASKLCLSCHDGSYGGISGAAKFTTLANSHPVSFTYNTAIAAKVPNGTLRNPSVASSGLTGGTTIATDLLDKNSKMQCTTCHDIHSSGKGEFFLRWDYNAATGTDSVMCRVCHNK